MQTFDEAVSTWFKFRSVSARPATLGYHRELAKIIFENWPGDPHAPVSTILDGDVAEFAVRVAHYSAPRFNGLVSVIKAVCGDAARQLRRRRVTVKRVTLPTQTEFAALLRELDACKHGHSGLMVRFLALTGLRIGEARKLTWGSVTERGLLVPGAINKSGRERLIPFIGDLRGVLDRLRAIGDGERILPQDNCRYAFATAAKRAGLAFKPTHHDMRRLWATRVLECGVDLPTASRWFGHGDGGSLMGRSYFHLMQGHSSEMAGRVKIAA